VISSSHNLPRVFSANMTSNQAWDTASVEEKKHDVIHDEGDAASQANVLVVTPEDVSRLASFTYVRKSSCRR
jgi:hypothetical protein